MVRLRIPESCNVFVHPRALMCSIRHTIWTRLLFCFALCWLYNQVLVDLYDIFFPYSSGYILKDICVKSRNHFMYAHRHWKTASVVNSTHIHRMIPEIDRLLSATKHNKARTMCVHYWNIPCGIAQTYPNRVNEIIISMIYHPVHFRILKKWSVNVNLDSKFSDRLYP